MASRPRARGQPAEAPRGAPPVEATDAGAASGHGQSNSGTQHAGAASRDAPTQPQGGPRGTPIPVTFTSMLSTAKAILKTPDQAIRELIDNAVMVKNKWNARNIRVGPIDSLEPRSGDYFKAPDGGVAPAILAVIDNGVGMTKDEFDEAIKIGHSDGFDYDGESGISMFGEGMILALLLLCEDAMIATRSRDAPGHCLVARLGKRVQEFGMETDPAAWDCARAIVHNLDVPGPDADALRGGGRMVRLAEGWDEWVFGTLLQGQHGTAILCFDPPMLSGRAGVAWGQDRWEELRLRTSLMYRRFGQDDRGAVAPVCKITVAGREVEPNYLSTILSKEELTCPFKKTITTGQGEHKDVVAYFAYPFVSVEPPRNAGGGRVKGKGKAKAKGRDPGARIDGQGARFATAAEAGAEDKLGTDLFFRARRVCRYTDVKVGGKASAMCKAAGRAQETASRHAVGSVRGKVAGAKEAFLEGTGELVYAKCVGSARDIAKDIHAFWGVIEERRGGRTVLIDASGEEVACGEEGGLPTKDDIECLLVGLFLLAVAMGKTNTGWAKTVVDALVGSLVLGSAVVPVSFAKDKTMFDDSGPNHETLVRSLAAVGQLVSEFVMAKPPPISGMPAMPSLWCAVKLGKRLKAKQAFRRIYVLQKAEEAGITSPELDECMQECLHGGGSAGAGPSGVANGASPGAAPGLPGLPEAAAGLLPPLPPLLELGALPRLRVDQAAAETLAGMGRQSGQEEEAEGGPSTTQRAKRRRGSTSDDETPDRAAAGQQTAAKRRCETAPKRQSGQGTHAAGRAAADVGNAGGGEAVAAAARRSRASRGGGASVAAEGAVDGGDGGDEGAEGGDAAPPGRSRVSRGGGDGERVATVAEAANGGDDGGGTGVAAPARRSRASRGGAAGGDTAVVEAPAADGGDAGAMEAVAAPARRPRASRGNVGGGRVVAAEEAASPHDTGARPGAGPGNEAAAPDEAAMVPDLPKKLFQRMEQELGKDMALRFALAVVNGEKIIDCMQRCLEEQRRV